MKLTDRLNIKFKGYNSQFRVSLGVNKEWHHIQNEHQTKKKTQNKLLKYFKAQENNRKKKNKSLRDNKMSQSPAAPNFISPNSLKIRKLKKRNTLTSKIIKKWRMRPVELQNI